MIKGKFLFILLFFGAASMNSFGQAAISGVDVDLQEKTPQSPNAGSLGKFFSIPVNMATGIPNISIPLYTIKTGGITMPITLSYHAGGVQVNDISSWVGCNWSLIAGGSIVKKTNGLDDYYGAARIINGTPDQSYTTPNYSLVPYCNGAYNNMTDALDYYRSAYASSIGLRDSVSKFFASLVNGFIDGESDEYNYSIPGGSGKFYYNQKTAAYQSAEINGSTLTTPSGGPYTITAKDGKTYAFGIAEQITNPSYMKSRTPFQYLYTAFHLNYIADPVTGKNVTLHYVNYYKSSVPMGDPETKDYKLTSSMNLFATNDGDNYRSGDNYVLDSVFFNDGIVCFIKDTTTRPDYGPNSLKEIKVLNSKGLLLKRFRFSYYYDSSRLFLKSLQETEYNGTGDSLFHPAYQFNYDTSHHLPVRLSFAQDKWGFYNGRTSNTTSIPSPSYVSAYPVMAAADRDVDSVYAKAGMLTGIVYPTGGKSVFEYESNRIDANTSLVGGQRIKRITHIDSVAQKNLVTEYAYGGGDLLTRPVFDYDFYHMAGDIQSYSSSHIYRLESTPVNNMFPNQGSPIYYSFVEKREKSPSGDFLSRHYFDRLIEPGDIYENSNSVPHAKQLGVKDMPETYTELYVKDPGSSNYTVIQKDSSIYSSIASVQHAMWDVQAAWNYAGFGWVEWPGLDATILYPMEGYMIPSLHALKIMPSSYVKSEQYTKAIANGVTLTTPSFYEYDSTNGNMKVAKSVNSKGDTTIKMVKYASDYIYTGTYPSVNFEISSLIDYNIIGDPIEIITLLKKKDSTNSIVQSALLYEYEGLKLKKVYKVFDQIPYSSFTVSYNNTTSFYKDSHYKLQEEVTAWDGEGRPLTVINNTNYISYTRDGAYDEPTAVTNNASYQDVAYSSFESAEDGGWIVNSSSRDTTYRITGKKSYQLSNGNIKKTGLTSSRAYIVSYWSRNGSGNSYYTVTGSSSVKEGRTVGGWTYYEHTVSGIDSVTISGSSYIDELRLYPKSAQMVSFCYEPLLGMTTQCDAANHITYYEYEGPDKLSLIRDQDRNILKKICYNYAGQTVSCAATCGDTSPNWQNTTTAPTCLTDGCGNTGYQKQEQKDFNLCSSTFGSTRWDTLYNPSACSLAGRLANWQNITDSFRCVQGACGNNGYREAKQRDINTCSSSYNSTRWVFYNYDTTACSIGHCYNVDLTSTNIGAGDGWAVTYHNIYTDSIYTFNIASETGSQPLGTIPNGHYDVSFAFTGLMTINPFITWDFYTGCGFQVITGNSAIFYNVSVSDSDCNSITIIQYSIYD